MHIYTEYFQSNYVKEIQKLFIDYFTLNRINKDEIDRDELFNFSKSMNFIEIYHKLAYEIVKKYYKFYDNILLQPSVTIRLFKNEAHGTSFHTDYLYGHGKDTNTVWVPIYGLKEGNTFKILNNNLKNKYELEDIALNYNKNLENNLLNDSFEVFPANDQCVIFNSKVIHGSPKNTSSFTRYSFDFRISLSNDTTSTKKLNEYLKLKNRHWVEQINQSQNLLFLKYICGGNNKDTSIQHEIIEFSSRKNNFQIVGQEAEIERFGYHVFKRHLSENSSKNFNAIIIASDEIIDEECKNLLKKSKIKVFSVLQGIFLN